MPRGTDAARAVVRPSGPYVRTVRVPGSKSLAARAMTAAALAPGVSSISGIAGDRSSDDALLFVEGLRALGVPVDGPGKPAESAESAEFGAGLWRVSGLDPSARWSGGGRVDAGGSATAARFLTAISAFCSAPVVIDGSDRMRLRPMEILFDALGSLGVRVEPGRAPGRLPATVHPGGSLRGGTLTIPATVSSQFFSALLLAGSRAAGEIRLVPDEDGGTMVSRPYVDLTLSVLGEFGVSAGRVGEAYVVRPGGARATDFAIEPDASAACFAFAAAAVTGGTVTVPGLTRASRQPDVRFLDVLEQMGCAVEETPAGVTVRGGPLRGVSVDLSGAPDSVPPLAAVASVAEGATEITGVGHLRHKESDRLSALTEGLCRIGARVEERPGGLRIERVIPDGRERDGRGAPGGPAGRGGVAAEPLDPRNDHRNAMAFAVAGLAVGGVVVADPGCVSKSFPRFWEEIVGAPPVSGEGPSGPVSGRPEVR